MGFFDLFKKKPVLQDEFFGPLKYVASKDPSSGYFEGRGFFSPTNDEPEYFINADETGPTDEQKEFYTRLQNNFDVYIEKMKPMIEAEFRNWKEDFEIRDFNKELMLVGITIPRFDAKPLIWDMSFTTIHDEDHQITIDFIDHEPDSILIDG